MNSRSCRDIRADLSAYLDDDLDAGRAGEILSHLERCDACSAELVQLRLTVGALRRLPEVPPPAAILAGVRARLRPEPWYRRLPGNRQWLFGVPAGALATLLVVVGISLFQKRFPEMSQPGRHVPISHSPAPSRPAQLEAPSPVAPQPTAGATEDARRAAASAARSTLRAKGSLSSTTLPQGVSSGARLPAPASKAVVGSEDKVARRAASAEPVTEPVTQPVVQPVAQPVPQPVVQPVPQAAPQPVLAEAESKAEQVPPTPPALPVAKLKDALREQPTVGGNRAAPSAARADGGHPVEQLAEAMSAPKRDGDAIGAADEKTAALPPPAAFRKAGRTQFVRQEADSSLERAGVAEIKAPAPVRILIRLPPGSNPTDDLERILRREGAEEIVVEELEPGAVREALASYRGQLGSRERPARGWTMSARVPARALPRLLEALASRPGVLILERPTLATAPAEPTQPLELRITAVR